MRVSKKKLRVKKSCFTKNTKMERIVSGQIHPGGLKNRQHIEKKIERNTELTEKGMQHFSVTSLTMEGYLSLLVNEPIMCREIERME